MRYFEDITLGRFLPVSLEWTPFLVSLAAGALCLAIYVAPGVIGARAGLIVQKMRAARPPSEPFFHRYYIDIGLMVIGGLIFWELFSRRADSNPAACSTTRASTRRCCSRPSSF